MSAEKRSDSKRLGAFAVAALTTMGFDTPVSFNDALDAIMGDVECPNCKSHDIDPMCSAFFCRTCSHLWRPADDKGAI